MEFEEGSEEKTIEDYTADSEAATSENAASENATSENAASEEAANVQETQQQNGKERPPGKTNGDGSQMWSTFVLIALLFAVMYIMLIRPQKKREQQRQEMLSRLQTNDKVVTIGGIIGTVDSLTDKEAVIRLEDNTKMRVTRNAISRIVSGETPE